MGGFRKLGLLALVPAFTSCVSMTSYNGEVFMKVGGDLSDSVYECSLEKESIDKDHVISHSKIPFSDTYFILFREPGKKINSRSIPACGSKSQWRPYGRGSIGASGVFCYGGMKLNHNWLGK